MVEVVFKAANQRLGPPIRRLIDWLCFGPSGGWIALTVVVLVGARYAWVQHERARCDAIAEAFGSVGYLYGTPQASPDGNRLTFIQTTTNGVGIFEGDTAGTERNLVFEERGDQKYGQLDLALWPWSPDGKYFLYSRGALNVCRADTAEPVAKIPVWKRPVTLVWLTTNKFAYVTPDGGVNVVRHVKDQWQNYYLAGVQAGTNGFGAYSDEAVIWTHADCLWTCNLASRNVNLLYAAPAGQSIAAMDCSRNPRRILLKMTETATGKTAIWWAVPGWNPQRIAACPPDATGLRWIIPTNYTFAYLCAKGTNTTDHALILHQGYYGGNKSILHGNTQTYAPTPDGRSLLVQGVATNEIAEGVWQYDVAKEQLQCAVPCTDHPSPDAHHVEPLHDRLQLASGEWLDYYVFPPAHFDRHQHRKYPLVLGDTQLANPENQDRIQGPLWAQAVACCDGYVVIINRKDWFAGLDQWGTNVMAVYQLLANHPTIDTRHVFLFGASAETWPLSLQAKENPELWHGLLLLNPSGLPLPAILPPGENLPRVLISTGEKEYGESLFKEYQAETRQNGIPVEVVLHANATHWLVSIDAMQARTKAITDFIFR